MSFSNENPCLKMTWNIVNVSLCTLRKYQGFFSPSFRPAAYVNTEWYLKFTPDAGENGELAVEVTRKCLEKLSFGRLDYELAFVTSDGTILPNLKIVDAHKSEISLAENLYIQPCQLVGNKKGKLLYQDELLVELKIWTNSVVSDYCWARTEVSKMDFFWNVTKMPEDKDTRVSKVFKLTTLHFAIILDEFDPCHPFLDVRFIVFTTHGEIEDFAHCKVSVNDADGEDIELFDFFACCGEKPLSLQIRTKLEYLVDDILPLKWQFTSGIGATFREKPRNLFNQATQTSPVPATTVSFPRKNTMPCNNLQEDLLHLYMDKKFNDATLVSGGISFPVHKSILSARSNKFRDMFSEKKQSILPTSGGCIDCLNQDEVFDIKDLEPDTLERMLLFIYTDTFQNLPWDSVSSLYEGASKYGILCLKQKCRSVLKDALSVSNACEILSFADTHQDLDLVQYAWKFLCEHKEVVGSQGWLNLEAHKSYLTLELLKEMREIEKVNCT